MGLLQKLFGRGGGYPPDLAREIEKAMNGLKAVTSAHDATWHIGAAAWNVDQDAGTIVFTTPDLRATAPVQIIGTYNTQDGTWLWGWDHPSVVPALAEHAKKVQAHGKQHGFVKLTTRKLACSEQECSELTALAFMLCGANGAYRGPSGPTLVFMTFGEIQLSKPAP